MFTATAIKVCRECGSTHLTWHTSAVNKSDVAEGRLRTSDVGCIFYLGCDECRETLAICGAEQIAHCLNLERTLP